VIWGARGLAFGSQAAGPKYLSRRDQVDDYLRSPGAPSAPPFPFGIVDPRGDKTRDGWREQREWHRRRNDLHAIAPRDSWNVSESPRAERFWWTKPFAPSDRCRQIVVWAVDWKSYEDAEMAPSAPVDLSKLGRNLDPNWLGGMWWEWQGNHVRMDISEAGNPEKLIAWMNPRRDATMYRLPPQLIGSTVNPLGDPEYNGIFYRGLDETWSPWWTLGYWGADRNGDGVCNVGPVPKTTRMRAVEVARFVYYDPVAHTGLQK
jgi:hypothetical protein